MAQFSVNAQRFDPYKNFKFRVKWDGRYVAGISKVGALKRSTELVINPVDPGSKRTPPQLPRCGEVALPSPLVSPPASGLSSRKEVKRIWEEVPSATRRPLTLI